MKLLITVDETSENNGCLFNIRELNQSFTEGVITKLIYNKYQLLNRWYYTSDNPWYGKKLSDLDFKENLGPGLDCDENILGLYLTEFYPNEPSTTFIDFGTKKSEGTQSLLGKRYNWEELGKHDLYYEEWDIKFKLRIEKIRASAFFKALMRTLPDFKKGIENVEKNIMLYVQQLTDMYASDDATRRIARERTNKSTRIAGQYIGAGTTSLCAVSAIIYGLFEYKIPDRIKAGLTTASAVGSIYNIITIPRNSQVSSELKMTTVLINGTLLPGGVFNNILDWWSISDPEKFSDLEEITLDVNKLSEVVMIKSSYEKSNVTLDVKIRRSVEFRDCGIPFAGILIPLIQKKISNKLRKEDADKMEVYRTNNEGEKIRESIVNQVNQVKLKI